MRLSLKRLGAAAVAAALSLSVVACSKPASTGGAPAGGGPVEMTLWSRTGGAGEEAKAYQTIVDAYNASQTKYKVKIQQFPQDTYNASVVAAAAAKKLPCLLEIDQPNVAGWAWGGYLAPIEGMDDILAKYLPSTVAKWNGKPYAYGYHEVSVIWVTREATLKKFDIRKPTPDKPWTGDEFAGILKKLKDSGDFEYPADLDTSVANEWWPYGFGPMLQSFGGDLINRTDYKSAEGVLNGPEAIAWAKWFASLGANGYIPKKSAKDPIKDIATGKRALVWTGMWAANGPDLKGVDDVVYAPPVDFGKGPKVGGGSWTWGQSTNCATPEGSAEFLKFAAADEWVATMAKASHQIPATDAATAMVDGFKPGQTGEIFRTLSKRFTVMRPETPGYPFIATEFTKAAQDILAGGDPKEVLDAAVKNIDANQKQNNYFQ